MSAGSSRTLRQAARTAGPCRRTTASNAAGSRSRRNWASRSASGASASRAASSERRNRPARRWRGRADIGAASRGRVPTIVACWPSRDTVIIVGSDEMMGCGAALRGPPDADQTEYRVKNRDPSQSRLQQRLEVWPVAAGGEVGGFVMRAIRYPRVRASVQKSRDNSVFLLILALRPSKVKIQYSIIEFVADGLG